VTSEAPERAHRSGARVTPGLAPEPSRSGVRAPARALLAAGAAITVLGLAIAGTAPVQGLDPNVDKQPTQQVAGGVVVLVGWIVLGYGIHRFGRGT
jgi:hypothetical protein